MHALLPCSYLTLQTAYLPLNLLFSIRISIQMKINHDLEGTMNKKSNKIFGKIF